MKMSIDEERELIDKVAQKISDLDMEDLAIFILQTIKPLSMIGGELAYFYLAPFLPLLDEYGYLFVDTFGKIENIEALIKKLKKLHKEKKMKEQKTKSKSAFLRRVFFNFFKGSSN